MIDLEDFVGPELALIDLGTGRFIERQTPHAARREHRPPRRDCTAGGEDYVDAARQETRPPRITKGHLETP